MTFTDLVFDWDDRAWAIAEDYVKAMDESQRVRELVEAKRSDNEFESRFHRAVLHMHDQWKGDA
jgi:HD superfamily phosphohydrolase YqeK